MPALILAKLSGEKLEALKVYLKRRILGLKTGMKTLYEDKIIKWRSAYEARPREAIRQFPFQNASNIIVPVIAIHTDTLHAQIMAAIFKTRPLVVAKILGDFGPDAVDTKEAYEEFMVTMGTEPDELDLYRVYNEGYRECIKYGTVTWKCPWEDKTRDFVIPGGDGSGSSRDFLTETIYTGPRPEKLPFDAFYLPPMAKTLDDTDIKAHKRIMLRHELEERKFTDIYEREAVESVLSQPDRTSPTESQKQKEEKLGAKTDASYGHQEWDIWECYISYRYEDEAFAPRMIATYHEKSDTILRVVYDNWRHGWFVGARMAHRDDMYFGEGYAETLWQFQEGASESFNGYQDNLTVSNTRIWRANPDSKLHQGYRIYPSVMLPAEKDELEAMAQGDPSQINIEVVRLLLELGERRSGVSPPQQGFGAGVMTGKRGIYSAMGTLSILQEGNSRKDLNVSDMRDAHVRLMRLISYQYGEFGRGNKFHDARLALFGKKAYLIKQALDKIVSGEMGLPLYSSTASINKEVEKQNDIMLSQIMARHYQMVAQLLGMMQSMMSPPLVKQYGYNIIQASNFLMKSILRNFGHDEVDRLVPDPFKPQGGSDVIQQASGGAEQVSGMAGVPGGENIQ